MFTASLLVPSGELDRHAARDFDALRVDPAVVFGEEGGNHGPDIVRHARVAAGGRDVGSDAQLREAGGVGPHALDAASRILGDAGDERID
jgi:hypothetical protein